MVEEIHCSTDDIISFKMKKVIKDFHEFFSSTSEYGIGFLDGLSYLLDEFKIPYVRTEDNLLLEGKNYRTLKH